MKSKITFFFFLISCAISAQTVLIPNGGFNTDVSGWSITGTDTSISQENGYLRIDVSGGYSRDFVLKSTSFYLEANKTYKLHGDYRHTQFDPGTGMESPLGTFTDVFLKDNVNNTTVTGLWLTTCNDLYNGFQGCFSSDFTVSTSGVYYLEFSGQQDPADTDYFLDNVGFEGITENSFNGTVSLDVNNNGCATGATVINNFPIKLTETNSNTIITTNTDTNGNFTIESNWQGTFITQINHPHYNSSPTNYSETFASGSGNHTVNNQNFCILPNGVVNDVTISIIPTTQARPGFDTSYQIRYTNFGNTSLNGSVQLTFDNSKVSFLNASTITDSQTTNSLTWNYASLAPLETRYIDVHFNIATPPTVNNGDILSYTASVLPVSGDYTPSNNTFIFNQITIGSYDPNDITALEGDLISPAQATEYLHYLIRFQNTGTASAINIRVENTLSNFLDWATFEPVAASHNFYTTITNGNEVHFNFNNINLADNTSSEPESHGWVLYKIKPKNSFIVGDEILNTAQIYFDFNLPIITNTASTQISTALGINNNYTNSFSLTPNPAKNNLTIAVTEKAHVTIFNLNGQKIYNGNLKKGNNTIQISKLTSGIYFIKVKTNTKNSIKKFIKK